MAASKLLHLIQFNNFIKNFYPSFKRYFYNSSFFDGTGPVFLYIVGEWDASPNDVVYGSMVEYARKFNALCVSLEHRFYGESKPTEYKKI